ncbi:acyl-CoA synthetase [Gordonia alkaliphila]|uniref:acyl-CoA synthetase n=1 Tax=Gordonia alkaliphila TaxID=1053547 RepID=UPI001FF50E6B|nr:acyl-CoA synthetase [Gordonia alkaliphila]MCK0438415.1 acyl-CoA synthetase [Gordonia alkaliphila]
MSKLGTIIESLSDAVGAVKVMSGSGAIDLSNPKRVIGMVKSNKLIGPTATVLAHKAIDIPDAPAVSDEHGTLTWAEFDAQVNMLGNAFLGAGLRPGSVVGIIARDHRAVPMALCAAGRSGVRLAMMNTGFGATQFAEVATREGVEAILYDEEFSELADTLPDDLLRIVTWTDGEQPIRADARTLDDIVAAGDPTPPPMPEAFGGMVILTSGTTGLPKGASRNKFAPFASALILDRIPLPRNGSMVIVSPIFHSTGFALWGVGLGLANETVLMRRFDAEKTLAAIERHRSQALVAVPTMLHRMIALGPEVIGKYDLSSLETVVVAGSALSPTLCEEFQDAFGDVLYNLYGSTEVGVATVAQPAELRRAPGTIGKPPVTSHMALFDDDGRRITATNTKGRLFVRTGAPFEGYTDGRNKDFIDGYMSSGDMAYVDDDGLWFIAGRDDDMIVSGGENVYPLEVENLLAEHPHVDDVAVIGVDDDEYGTRLRAFIVLAEGAPEDPDALRAHVKANLARYKVPRDVVYIEDLPRNPTGKLVRRLLPTGPLEA